MASKGISLRRTLVVAFVAVGILAAVESACLIFLTTLLHQSSRSLGEALEGVRVAEGIGSNLLLIDRAPDFQETALSGELRQRLQEMGQYVSNDEERLAYRRTGESVEAYLRYRAHPEAARVRDPLLLTAYGDLGRLVEINLAQAREAEESAALWNRMADVVGAVALALVGIIICALVWHLTARAFRPVFALANAIDRFSRGDYDARAEETGPTELREIAGRFNAMADALARQRADRLAFLSGVAHDLRNPLNVVQMGVELLALESDEEGRLDALTRIRRQLRRLERMTMDFMDAAQIESGAVKLALQVARAQSLAGQSVDLLSGVSPKHTLELVAPAEDVWVECDPHRVEQVLVNLIGNAVKYSPRGGRVGVEVRAGAGTVVFAVSDEGIGLTAEESASLFEPFRRVGSLRSEIPGTGLGLSIVRRLVNAHGGHIEVVSEPGRGSRFEVHLPRWMSAPEPGMENPVAASDERA